MRRARQIVLLFTLFISSAIVSHPVQAQLPLQFESTTVTPDVAQPTDLAFLPDGRLLVAEQAGRLKTLAAGTLVLVATTDMTSITCNFFERGLLGVAADPNFTTPGSNWIYLFYTFKKTANCNNYHGNSNEPVNRVSRFTMNGNVLALNTEQVLLDNMPSVNGNHNGGDLAFGKDGKLYVSIGDSGCDYQTTNECGGDNDAARDRNILLGKILRINSDGTIPADNPFTGANTERCNTTGRTTPGNTCQETFAWGLRNPFRFAFDPDAATTRFMINDVGQGAFEEVNLAQAGADYGWPCREGPGPGKTGGTCDPPPQNMVAPFFTYAHSQSVPGTDSGNCRSITAAVFVPDAANWPAEYDGAYLFGDSVCGKIMRIASNGSSQTTATMFETEANTPIAMVFGPDGTKTSLYYISYDNGLRRIRFTGTLANRAPQAVIGATPRSGAAPLQVTFTGSGSSDPDAGNSISHSWDFGDGGTSSSANPQHTYTSSGRFTAKLTVTDNGGLTSEATITIDVGGPQPTIAEPAAGVRFRVGENVTLRATATTAAGTPLTGSDVTYTWQLLLHHRAGQPDTHTHPLLGPINGQQIQLIAPSPEDVDAASNSFVEIRLTATDSAGLTGTVTRMLEPRKVMMTVDTEPAGRRVLVNSVPFTGRQTFTSWEGYRLALNAPLQGTGLNTLRSTGWSNGGAAQQVVTTGSSAETFIARFGEAFLCTLPQVQR